MKGLLIAAGAACSAVLAVAPVAAADTAAEEFSNNVSAAGFNITSDNQIAWLALGLAVCVDLFNGMTPGQVVTDAVDVGMPRSEAQEFVAISVTGLCPSAAVGAVA